MGTLTDDLIVNTILTKDQSVFNIRTPSICTTIMYVVPFIPIALVYD